MVFIGLCGTSFDYKKVAFLIFKIGFIVSNNKGFERALL